MKSKTEVLVNGPVRVTIEQLEAPDGTVTYRATGRKFGKMAYVRDFSNFHELKCFVNRSAGQSIRRMFERAYSAGFVDGYKEAGGVVLEDAQ